MTNRPKTKLLVDGGDPHETAEIKRLLGFVDGQTTNPSLIAKNPDVARRVSAGQKLTPREERDAYRSIVQALSPLVGTAGVSIEVFADLDTTAEDMVRQGRDMFSWVPNAYVKYPCTPEGLRAAEISVREGIRVNMTLCFSQEQAAAVYAATRGTKEPAYVSPFIGRLDDIGQNGVDLVANIQRMYAQGDGHVLVLAASLRTMAHLQYCFSVSADLATVPAKLLREWVAAGLALPDSRFSYEPIGTRLEYRELDLQQPWGRFNVAHDLTTKGVKKFVADYRATLSAKTE